MVPSIIVTTLINLGLRLLTSSVIEKVLLLTLKQIAKKTDNQIDDELVSIVEQALNPAQKAQLAQDENEQEQTR
jgi:hypothetical protein